MTTATAPALSPTTTTPPVTARLTVDYWTVAMDGQNSCGSCDAALTALTGAADTLRPLAETLGIAIHIVPRAVTSWEEAVEHGITASPTIRAAGTELRPEHPDDSETRLWAWRGAQYPAPPEAALLDLLLRALSARSADIGDYLAQGGPSRYVRQFLTDTTPAPLPVAAQPDASCC